MRAHSRRAVIRQLHDPRLKAAAHEIILEVEPAFLREQARSDTHMDHRQQSASTSGPPAEVCSDGGKALALSQPARPLDMRSKVAIAELEPGLAAELLERRHEGPGLVTPAPAALAIVEAGERVHQRVEIGRDRQAEML